jgi:hypothetical protein
MRSMQWQLGVLGTISAFAFRHRETKKNLCRGGRSQNLPQLTVFHQILYLFLFFSILVTCHSAPFLNTVKSDVQEF